MAKQPLSKSAKKQNSRPAKTTLAAAKKAVAQAAGAVAGAVAQAADAAQEHVVRPVARAVGVGQPAKKARFARGKKKAGTPEAKAALPPRSKSAAGKLMSKNLKVAPKDEGTPGPKPAR